VAERIKLTGEGTKPEISLERRICISGLWLRRIGDKVQALIEWHGHWYVACEEHFDGPFSHIVEYSGMMKAPLDEVTEPRAEREQSGGDEARAGKSRTTSKRKAINKLGAGTGT